MYLQQGVASQLAIGAPYGYPLLARLRVLRVRRDGDDHQQHYPIPDRPACVCATCQVEVHSSETFTITTITDSSTLPVSSNSTCLPLAARALSAEPQWRADSNPINPKAEVLSIPVGPPAACFERCLPEDITTSTRRRVL